MIAISLVLARGVAVDRQEYGDRNSVRDPGTSMTLPQPKQPAAGPQRLRRLSGEEAISFVSYGLRIGIQTNQPGGLDWLIPLLPPGWRPARSPAVHYLY